MGIESSLDTPHQAFYLTKHPLKEGLDCKVPVLSWSWVSDFQLTFRVA